MRRSRVLSVLSLASLAFAARPARVRAQAPPDKLTVAGVPSEDLTNLYYAVKTGLFARASLDVEIVSTSSGSVATTAVIAGTYAMAKTSPLTTFAAHLRDIPILAVAPELLNLAKSPFALLQVPPDSNVKTGADLNGKTVSVTALNDVNTLAIRAWVDKNGGDWRSLKYVEIPLSATEAALAAHRVEAAIISTPFLDESLTNGTTKSIGDAWSAIAPAYMIGIYVARREWADAHADALHRFNRVLADATRYVNAHPAETLGYAAEFTKIDQAKLAKIRRSTNGTALDPALLQPVIDAAVKYETLPRGFNAREIIWSG